jgi:hypothetical protein
MEVKISNIRESVNIDKYPDKCPFCHRSITPDFIIGLYRNPFGHSSQLEITFRCPSDNCLEAFISYYWFSHRYGGNDFYRYDVTMFGSLEPIEISKVIEEISVDYCKIYRDSVAAEQFRLKQICGVGYRKSLEFLIKDYLIKVKKKDENIIKPKFLSKCIDQDIDNDKIKKVAKRAAWLGNDETHYFRIWEDKDIINLKDLIRLTVSWIEDEALTEKYVNDMPE